MLRKPRQFFSETLRTHEGHKFRGEFGDPNSVPRPRREMQNLPHRALVTSRSALAKPGDLVSWRDIHYLLVSQHTLGGLKRFMALETNLNVKWTRSTETMDPIARVNRDTKPVTLNPSLRVAFEPARDIDEENFEITKYRMFTHENVLEGDRINDMNVLRHFDILGVRVAEIA